MDTMTAPVSESFLATTQVMTVLATLGIRVHPDAEGGITFAPDDLVCPSDRAWLTAHPAEALAAQAALDNYRWTMLRAIILQVLIGLLHQEDVRGAAESAARKLYDELGASRAQAAVEAIRRLLPARP